MEDVIRRIQQSADDPDLLAKLVALPGADLQSLLMEVYRRRAEALTPHDALRDYQTNRFTKPVPLPAAGFARIEQIAHPMLDVAGFQVLELAPLAPLGCSSALAPVSQNKIVSALRGEVVSDPTNVLALEATLRRRERLSADPRDGALVKLAANHRVTRVFSGVDDRHFAHFRILGLVTAGRDPGDRAFEKQALTSHLALHVSVVLEATGLPPEAVQVSLTPLDEGAFGARLEAWASELQTDGIGSHDRTTALSPRHAIPLGVRIQIDRERMSGRGYYESFCFKIHADHPEHGRLEFSDGGCVGWTRELLGSKKERCFISGTGVDRLVLTSPR